MKPKGIFFSVIFFSLISFAFNGSGDPEFTGSKHLFKIGRSRDANEIVYEINLDSSGKLNSSNPIRIYWVKKTDNGQVEPLTWVQNRYAYGLHFINVSDYKADFQFVSYGERTFTVKRTSENVFKVFTMSQDKEVEVNTIFIQIDGGSFWVPTIPKVDLYAYDTQSGLPVVETIHP